MDCREGSKLILDQIESLIIKLTDEQYAKALPIFEGSSIGKHVRHIYNFYSAIVQTRHTGELDYAKRIRDPQIECHINCALSKLSAMKLDINDLDEDLIIDVVTEFDTKESTLRKRVSSSIGRELMYAHDHAVHHLAIVKMGLQSAFPEIDYSRTLGVALSTIKHRQHQ